MAYALIETEKSHDLLSASWTTREAGDTIQCKSLSESKSLRTRNTSVLGQKMGISGPAKSTFALLLPFCSIQVFSRLVDICPYW